MVDPLVPLVAKHTHFQMFYHVFLRPVWHNEQNLMYFSLVKTYETNEIIILDVIVLLFAVDTYFVQNKKFLSLIFARVIYRRIVAFFCLFYCFVATSLN